jgi:NAD(P)-dependent dehydrogenase (short-subunit alcohol dehydrogenase family)
VANAGILGELQRPEEVDEDNWRNIFATNVVCWIGRRSRSRDAADPHSEPRPWTRLLFRPQDGTLPTLWLHTQFRCRRHIIRLRARILLVTCTGTLQDGCFHTVRAAYPLLKRASHRGKVVITSSVAGEHSTQQPTQRFLGYACIWGLL